MPTDKTWQVILWALMILSALSTIAYLIVRHYADASISGCMAVLCGMCLGYIKELRKVNR